MLDTRLDYMVILELPSPLFFIIIIIFFFSPPSILTYIDGKMNPPLTAAAKS